MSNNNTFVRIHAKVIEQGAKDQIDLIVESPAVSGLIAIMPDVHQGAGCVIGFTGRFTDLVIPNIIGVDIGCGVIAYPLGTKKINLSKLDVYIRENIPLGFHKRNLEKLQDEEFVTEFMNMNTSLWNTLDFDLLPELHTKYDTVLDQIGTLGGGNHFIEIGIDDKKEQYILIHTGSRNIGKQIADFYQKKAKRLCKAMKIDVPVGLEYLPLEFGGDEYIKNMKLAQKFASENRKVILKIILRQLKVKFNEDDLIESVHNFIGEDHIIRKGAIASYDNQKVIIPFNMAEGSIIGVGKSNLDYNFSAPHGSGRSFGRRVMKNKLKSGEITMNDFIESMSGIFSTSVCEDTIDESKFAYKSYDDVAEHLQETVEIVTRLKPIYNLKSD